jgi:2,3,4,5-tetrahydropyridine-2-carboxylate N-succinyltransferase
VTKGPAAEAGIQIYTPVIVKYRDGKTAASVELESLLR